MTPHASRSLHKYTMMLALAIIAVSVSARGKEAPILRVVFAERSTILSGRVDSEGSAESLIAAVQSARPDLTPDRSGLTIDPTVVLPDLADIRSLLSELGLSTHEGRFELWPDHLVLGGLTDSLVTLTILRIQAKPLLAGRTLHSHLCIVGTDDLPKIEVSLADGQKIAMEAAPLPAATAETPFEAPGILLEKLLATIQLFEEIDRLAGRAGRSSPSGAPLRAEPLSATSLTSMPGPAGAPPQTPVSAMPVETFESLPSVFFSRNSFLLQLNQTETLDAVAKHLLSPARRGAPVRVEAVKASGGSTAFIDYLCERRGAEVARFLTERGVETTLMTMKNVESSSPIDAGEVRLLVEVLPLPVAPAAAPTNAVVPASGTALP